MTDDDVPPATATASEIHQNFWRKMAPRGEIDQILNGGLPVEKVAAESDEEIALRKKQIEIQLQEYEVALGGAVGWWNAWKQRLRGRGFRCMQDPKGGESA